jgi:anaerobic ribonucleoside-triphosphate reductase activating protein
MGRRVIGALLRLADVVWESIVDGQGIRCAVFVQGCPHHCEDCHNPQTHDPLGGYESTPDEIIARMAKNPLLRGITLTGGEPFQQPEAMTELARKAKAAGYDVVAYTGYTIEALIEMKNRDVDEMKNRDIDEMKNRDIDEMKNRDIDEMLKHIDILIDGPFILAEKRHDLLFRGSANQRIINVTEYFAKTFR